MLMRLVVGGLDDRRMLRYRRPVVGVGAVIMRAVFRPRRGAAAAVPLARTIAGFELRGWIARPTFSRSQPDLQYWFVNTAGVSATAQQPDAAKALIKYLTTPEAAAVIRAKGMEPLGR